MCLEDMLDGLDASLLKKSMQASLHHTVTPLSLIRTKHDHAKISDDFHTL